MTGMTLFCFPYAGGSADYYETWKSYLDPSIKLRPVDLAGRGSRLHEPRCDSIEEAFKDAYGIIKNEINERPYAFFGHSMGAIIAYELARMIRFDNMRGPVHVFFSGMRPPHVSKDDKDNYHKMSMDEFADRVVKLGGMPSGAEDHPELLQSILPVLRNDLMIAENYKPTIAEKALCCDITVMIGEEDAVNISKIDEWKRYTSGNCIVRVFGGGHFYIHGQTDGITEIINNTLIGDFADGKEEEMPAN